MRIFASIAAAIAMFLSPNANAYVAEYDWHTFSTTGGLPLSYAPVLRVDNSVLSTGLSFSMNCAPSPPQSCVIVGSTAGFISLTDTSFGVGIFDAELTFVGTGIIGSIFQQGENQYITESGDAALWTITQLLSDRYQFCDPCTATGDWELVVPEPSTIAILLAALSLLVLVLHRPRSIPAQL